MSDTSGRTTTEAANALFDRYTLPKVALAVILAASLVGTWVSATLDGAAGAALVLAKWAYFVAMAVLAGGLVWKHLFVRPADLGDGAADYCAEMYRRFDRIAVGAVVVLAVGGGVVLREYVGAVGVTVPLVAYAGLLGGWLALAAVTTARSDPVERQFRSRPGLAALALAVAVLVATGVAEGAIRGLDPVAAGVRTLHLLAFALWLGGAVWNIFVAVPTGKERPTIGVVRAAGEQLERFRWAVRFVIPTILATGLYQAVDALGTDAAPYLATAVGVAVLAKLGFIALLVVIFKLCPMWRACSPVEGVCDLEAVSDEGTDAAPSPDGTPPAGDPGRADDD